jgi:hypothetical protein
MQFRAGLCTEVGEGKDWFPRSMRLRWSRTLCSSFDGEFFSFPMWASRKKNAYFINTLKTF